MTPLEIKKHIIKDTIKPFFKNNGFENKGVKYNKNINHFQIKANIQSLRYYKKDNTEEFRINITIHPENSDIIAFGRFFIPSNASHITINENTNIEQLKVDINNDLNNLLQLFKKYNIIEEIVNEQLEEIKSLEDKIMEKRNELKKETTNHNLINILENTIKLYEKQINLISNWIKIVNK
jgi:Mg2+ and Co2+ transporter CorA